MVNLSKFTHAPGCSFSSEELGDANLSRSFFRCLFLVGDLLSLALNDRQLLSFLVCLLLFKSFLSVVERRVDNGQGQIEQEESSNEHKGHEKEKDVIGEHFLIQNHHVWPTLKCHTLEDCKQGPEDVVEACDIIIWIQNSLAAEIAFVTFGILTTDDFVEILVQEDVSRLNLNAPLTEHAREEIDAADCEYQEEEKKHDDRVLEEGQGAQDWLNNQS